MTTWTANWNDFEEALAPVTDGNRKLMARMVFSVAEFLREGKFNEPLTDWTNHQIIDRVKGGL